MALTGRGAIYEFNTTSIPLKISYRAVAFINKIKQCASLNLILMAEVFVLFIKCLSVSLLIVFWH